MKLISIYTKTAILSTLRNRSAFVFGIIFPAVLFLMFGHLGTTSKFDQIGSLVVFCNYAAQTIFFLSLGLQISTRRSSEWTIYKRTLPAPPAVDMISLIIEKSLSAVLALLLVIIANAMVYGWLISWSMTLYMILGAIVGGIPMAFLGIALGYRLNPESGRSIFVFANLALLFSAFAIPKHGFWIYVNMIIPAHHWARIVMSHYEAGDPKILPWVWMAGYGVLFYLLALWSYKTRKDLRKA